MGACYIRLNFAHADLLLCTTSRRFHSSLQSPVPVLIPSSPVTSAAGCTTSTEGLLCGSRPPVSVTLQFRSLAGSEETSTEHVSMASLRLQHAAHDSSFLKRPWLKYKYPPLVSTCMCLYMHTRTRTHLHVMWNVLLYAASMCCFYCLINKLFWSMVGQNITTWEIRT